MDGCKCPFITIPYLEKVKGNMLLQHSSEKWGISFSLEMLMVLMLLLYIFMQKVKRLPMM